MFISLFVVCGGRYVLVWKNICHTTSDYACMISWIVQMADAPTVAEAQPLPPALQIGQSLYLNSIALTYTFRWSMYLCDL